MTRKNNQTSMPPPATILSKFSSHLRGVLERTFALAREWGCSAEPEFFLWALTKERGCIAAEVLRQHGMSEEDVSGWMDRTHIRPHSPSDSRNTLLVLHEPAKHILEKSIVKASMVHHYYIGTEHLLWALWEWGQRHPQSMLSAFFKAHGSTSQQLGGALSAIIHATAKFPDIAASLSGGRGESIARETEEEEEEEGDAQTPQVLELFARNLTHHRTAKQLDPVIGREQEVERVIQILLRRTKNNPLLLGPAGVGKTAIVEGLAKRIAEGNVPEILNGKTIYALDMALLVSGSIFRGEFEARVKQVIEEARRNSNIILFIDEIHTMLGAGAAAGALDAANILKPALARGEIRCIGATTFDEYKKYMEKDAAFGRRFQAVPIAEPTPPQTIAMIQGLKPAYEQFHHVKITDEAIESAVRMAGRYLPERTFPDKAIDILDEALASVRLSAPCDPLMKKYRQNKEALEKLFRQKHDAVTNEQFDQALQLREQEQELYDQIQYCKKRIAKRKPSPLRAIAAEDIERVVRSMTGMEVANLSAKESKLLQELEAVLARDVIGQDHALRAVCSAIRRARSGFSNHRRPLGSFLFVGPSGVGKTELAKRLAETLFRNTPDGGIIRLDMSEFSESFTISKLIGAPAGYVGYRESGMLTDHVRQRPHSVVLFDELEKAHPDVFHLLLQVLEDGRLTDGSGRTVHFHETIIVMTTNVGSEMLQQQEIRGFGREDDTNPVDTQRLFAPALKNFFRPEFLNRIDSTIFFDPLPHEVLERIVDKETAALNLELAHKRVNVSLDEQTRAFLAGARSGIDHGARNIRQNMQQWIETPLADAIIDGRVKGGDTARFVFRNEEPSLVL